MKHLPSFWRWFVWAALGDWLITRLITRAAIHIPKTDWFIILYQGVAWFGQWVSTLAALLGFVTLGWLVWQSRHQWLAVALWGSLGVCQLLFLFVAPTGWGAVGYQLLLLALLGWLGVAGWHTPRWEQRGAVSLAGISLGVGVVYQWLPALYTALQWPGPAPFTMALFNFGELSVVLTPLAFWLAVRPAAIARRSYIWAWLPTLAFTGAHFANPSLTAILSIWSTGLTLYLPWPLYALSLYAASLVVLHALEHDKLLGWALLLLAAGGYAPQLGTQMAFAVLGLWLLTRPPEMILPAPPAHVAPAPLVLSKT